MMKHSILTKFKGTKSTKTTKTKKKVRWCKQLEEIHVFDPEFVNIASDTDLFLTPGQNPCSLDNQSPRDLQTMSGTHNAPSELQPRLEKLSIDKEQEYFKMKNKLVWRKVMDGNSSSFGEDWV